MKAFVALVFMVFAFVATLVGALYVSGGFTKEGLQKLLGIEAPAAAKTDEPASTEQIPELVAALKEQKAAQDEREVALKTEEKRLQEMRTQLEELRATLQGLVADATKSMDEADADRQARLQTVATSLGTMKPSQAAEAIADFAPPDAAALLQLVEDRQRGKILDSMKPDQAAAILRAMQDESIPVPVPQQ